MIGGVVGGILNVVNNSDKIDNFWDGFVYFNIGGLAGSTSVALSNLGSYGLSFTKFGGAIGGAMIGGPTGFVGEAMQSFLNSLYEGDSYSSSIGSGWDAGKQGFKWGTVLGGLGGGWDAYKQGNNIWTGAETGFGRSQWALNNSNKYTWDILNTPIMQTQYDCVPTSYSRQLQMLEEPYGYNDLVNSLNYNVNTGYTGSIGDFTDYLGKGTGYSVRLEQISVNKYSDKLMKSLSTQNIPIGHLEKMSQQYWHYSTVKSVTISSAGRVAIRVADPGGFTRRVFQGFYFQLMQNFLAY